MNANPKEALATTHYCDHDHPSVKLLAAKLGEEATSQKEIIQRTFLFVRDQIPFGFDLYRRKASQVLGRGHGVCWNKSLLLTALLRCNNIPAHFGSIPLRRNFIEPVIGNLYRMINDPYNHCLVHVWLEDRWVILEPALDQKTYNTIFLPLNGSWNIDWNGKDDCLLYAESVLGPQVMHFDIDETINNRCGNKEPAEPLAAIGNSHMNKKLWKKVGIGLEKLQAAEKYNLSLEGANREE